MPLERVDKQALILKMKGKRPTGRPRTRWQDYIGNLGWTCLGRPIDSSKMQEAVDDRDVLRVAASSWAAAPTTLLRISG